MRIDERCKSNCDERELGQRGAAPDLHELVVAEARAPERHDRLRERSAKREHEREMSDLDDHGLATPSPSCQRPCFLSASTTSRGI